MNEFNLEAGMPTADVAIRRLAGLLAAQRSIRTKAFKIIHGYGSTGKGGRLRTELRRYLDGCVKDGKIRSYICGEDFSIFSSATRELLARCPEAKRDRDLENGNSGVTIIVL